MGELVRKNAAVSDILADLGATIARAALRGGVWAREAEELLGPVQRLVNDQAAALAAAETTLRAAQAARQHADEQADLLLGRIHDELYNQLGRSAADGQFALLFPSGLTGMTEGAVARQPEQMRLLAVQLEGVLDPRFDRARTTANAAALRAAAEALGRAVDAAETARVARDREVAVRGALARSGHRQLTAYKRVLLARGYTQAQVHEVIPDRPTKKPSEAEAADSADAAPADPPDATTPA